ncbi:hypothetical protein Hanom_Chr13g01188281 [Helianthus anomalus]
MKARCWMGTMPEVARVTAIAAEVRCWKERRVEDGGGGTPPDMVGVGCWE